MAKKKRKSPKGKIPLAILKKRRDRLERIIKARS